VTDFFAVATRCDETGEESVYDIACMKQVSDGTEKGILFLLNE
jgi:hypothetical protein